MHKKTDDKTCLNCTNFKRHYIMGATDMFLTDYGYCKCPAMECKLIRIYEKNPACELWSPQREFYTESEKIISTLKAIKYKLNLIELLLDDK